MVTAALSIASGGAGGVKTGALDTLVCSSICFCLRRLHQTIIHSTAASPQRLFQEEHFREKKKIAASSGFRCERPPLS